MKAILRFYRRDGKRADAGSAERRAAGVNPRFERDEFEYGGWIAVDHDLYDDEMGFLTAGF